MIMNSYACSSEFHERLDTMHRVRDFLEIVMPDFHSRYCEKFALDFENKYIATLLYARQSIKSRGRMVNKEAKKMLTMIADKLSILFDNVHATAPDEPFLAQLTEPDEPAWKGIV